MRAQLLLLLALAAFSSHVVMAPQDTADESQVTDKIRLLEGRAGLSRGTLLKRPR
jgi:hypothetical protein